VLIAVLIAIASLLGIFNDWIYSHETANWALQGRGQDTGNLIALPILLISAYYLSKNSLKAYFIWLGTLIYYIYAYIIYSFSIHFNALFLVYVAVLGISAYTLIGGLMNKNFSQLTKQIPFKAKTKAAAIAIIAIAILFEALWLSDIIPALISGSAPKDLAPTGLWVNPVHIIDLSMVLPGMIITGILFLKKSRFGYLFTAPWLAFATLMGSSIVATFIMMFVQQSPDAAIQPLILVGIITLFSLSMLIVLLREIPSA